MTAFPRCLPAERRIAKERLRPDLARVSIADSNGRDIVEAVDSDGLLTRDRNVQRTLSSPLHHYQTETTAGQQIENHLSDIKASERRLYNELSMTP